MPHPSPLRSIAAALLLLAASAAQAQLEPSVYGVADFSYGRFEPSGLLPEHRYNSNSLTASFVGANLKYGFDGGWTAGITLETFVRFQDMKTGRRDADPLLSRNAFVSLGGPYGSVRVGRLQTYLFDTSTRFNAFGNSVAFSPPLRHLFASGNLEGVQRDFYWDRALSYSTPTLEGVTLNLMHSRLRDDDSGGLSGASLVVSQGLFAMALAAQRVRVDDGINDISSETTWQLGATYNFGLARVFGQYIATRDAGLEVRSKTASAGVSVALGPGNVLAQLAVTRADGPAVERRHRSLGVGYVLPYDSVTDFYLLAMDDRVRGQTRGVSAAVGVRWRY